MATQILLQPTASNKWLGCLSRGCAPVVAAAIAQIALIGLLTAPVSAQTYLPSVKVGTAALIAPSAADSFYGTGTTSTNGLGATVRPPEIVALARALKNDPDLIYKYVRNNIEVVWEYGLQKGALGASIDRAGTPFDQAMLMVELLRQAGYSATYEVGTITLSGTQFQAWTNITSATAACQLLSGGGIPALVNGTATANCAYGSNTISTVQMAHVWVKVAIAGSSCGSGCLYDPSYKPYTWVAGIDLNAATGFSAGAPLSAATGSMDSGSAFGLSYVHNLNATGSGGLFGLLQTYATNLLSYLRNNSMSGAEIEDIVSGGVIQPEIAPNFRQTSLPYATSVLHELSGNVPDQYRTTLYIKGQMRAAPGSPTIATLVEHTFFVDEIYGRRLTIDTSFTQASGLAAYSPYMVNLKLDGQVIDTPVSLGLTPNGHDPVALTITANHPYAAASDGSATTTGTYMDATIYKSAILVNPVTIVHGWGDTGPDLLAKWSGELVEDSPDPGRLNPPSCPGEDCPPPPYLSPSGDFMRAKVQASYLAQYTRAARLHAAIAGGMVQTHHVIGVIYGDDYVDDDGNIPRPGGPDYWVADSYTRLDVDTGLSFVSKAADSGKRRAAILSIAATSAALEGSVMSQMADLPDVSSTATRFEWGNAPPSAEDPSGAGPRKFFTLPACPPNTADCSAYFAPTGWMLWENHVTPPASVPTAPDGDPQAWADLQMSSLRSDIDAYVAAGFAVTAPQESFLGPGQRGGFVKVLSPSSWSPANTKQRGGAIIATKYDANGEPLEIAHDVVGIIAPDSFGVIRPSKGGGGGVQPNIAATYSPPDPADILKARFVDRSNALGVNLANGSITYQSPASLEIGTGGFPYALNAGFSWHPGALPTSDFGPLVPGGAIGWVSNWYNSLLISGSGMEGMGVSDVRAAAGTIAAFKAEQDIYAASPAPERDVAAALTQSWLTHQYSGNEITMNVGGSARQFVRLADGTWIAPGASYATLTQTGTRAPFEMRCGLDQVGPHYALSRGWDSSSLAFTVTGAHGDQQHFGYWLNHATNSSGPNSFCDRVTGFRLNSWNFPSGVSINLSYSNDVLVKDGGSRSTSPNANTFYPSSTTLGSISNSLGRVLTFGVNPTTQQPTVSDGSRTLTGIDQFSITPSTTDPAGAVTTFTFTGAVASPTQRPVPYPQLYRVFTADNPSQPNIEYDYDGVGQISQVRDAINLQLGTRSPWSFYIAGGTRGERDDPLGGAYSVVYDTYRHPARYIDENGHETDALLDGRGRVVSYTYPEGDQEVFTYDERNNPLSLTRKAGPTTTLADIVVSVAYGEGPTVAFCSNIVTCNRPATQTNARGGVTNLTWDSSTGFLTQTLLPADGSGLRPETDYSYSSFGGLLGFGGFQLLTGSTQRIDASRSLTTAYAYNGSNFYVPQSSTVDPSGLSLTTSYTFDIIGNPLQVDGPRTDIADLTNFTWDPDRREVFGIQADPDGSGPNPRVAFRSTYDAVGRVIAFDTGTTTSATGTDFASMLTVATAYDPAGEKVRETTPTRVTQVSYDGVGRVQCTAVRMNPAAFGALPADACVLGTAGSFGPDHIAKTIYDPAGQVVQEIRGLGTSVQQTYVTNHWTPEGRLSSVADALGHQTFYTYDGFGRTVDTVFADGTFENQAYYDAGGALCSSNGQPCTKQNRSGQVLTFGYDVLDRMTSKVVPISGSTPANTITTGYDLLGHVTAVSDTNGNILANAYDIVGRIASATRTTPLLSAKTVSYQYDQASNRTRLTWPDGYFATYSYDALNHPTTVADSGGTTLATYNYDGLARRTSLAYNGGTQMSYGWSPENDLTSLANDFAGNTNDVTFTNTFTPAHQWNDASISNGAFRYLPAATSTTAYGAVNAVNQYPSVGGTTLAYDQRGNLTSDGTLTLAYDAENRLTTAAKAGMTAAYAYDPNGRRSAKTVNGMVTNFLHDGDSEIAEYDGNGNLIRRFVPGPAIDQYIAMVSAGGSKVFFHTDKMGSVIAVSDTSGNLADGPTTYDAYGNCLSAGGACAESGSPFRFTGQRLDTETGLYFYRARYYSSIFGRFLQNDPVGYKDDLDLYTYVGNDPTDGVDPSGLEALDLNLGFVGASIGVDGNLSFHKFRVGLVGVGIGWDPNAHVPNERCHGCGPNEFPPYKFKNASFHSIGAHLGLTFLFLSWTPLTYHTDTVVTGTDIHGVKIGPQRVLPEGPVWDFFHVSNALDTGDSGHGTSDEHSGEGREGKIGVKVDAGLYFEWGSAETMRGRPQSDRRGKHGGGVGGCAAPVLHGSAIVGCNTPP